MTILQYFTQLQAANDYKMWVLAPDRCYKGSNAVTDPYGGDGGDRPPKRARKILLNVSKNKSSDRKLSLIPFVLSAY